MWIDWYCLQNPKTLQDLFLVVESDLFDMVFGIETVHARKMLIRNLSFNILGLKPLKGIRVYPQLIFFINAGLIINPGLELKAADTATTQRNEEIAAQQARRREEIRIQYQPTPPAPANQATEWTAWIWDQTHQQYWRHRQNEQGEYEAEWNRSS
jgi:hypothetical protein